MKCTFDNKGYTIPRQSGFTLIEIMVALFIFAILAIIVAVGLRMVLDDQKVIQQKAEQLTQLQLAIVIMQRDFTQITPRPAVDQNGVLQPAITGSSNSITFTRGGFANPLAVEKRSTLQRVSYQVEGNKLIRVTSEALDQLPQTVSNKQVILSDVQSLQFAYLDPKGQIHPSWPLLANNNMLLPNAIQVLLTMQGRGSMSMLFIVPGGINPNSPQASSLLAPSTTQNETL